MSPKHKLITLSWCVVTMLATMILSHGHLIMKEILAHWPDETTWEGRLENALYTQGGLTLVASIVISAALLARSLVAKRMQQESLRRELAMRERHERAASERHDAMLATLAKVSGDSMAKKSLGSGARPR